MKKVETKLPKFEETPATDEQIKLFAKVWLDAWGIIKIEEDGSNI